MGNISSSSDGSSICSSHGGKGNCSGDNCPDSGSRGVPGSSSSSASGGNSDIGSGSSRHTMPDRLGSRLMLNGVSTACGSGNLTTAWAAAKRVDHWEHPQSSSSLGLIKVSHSGSTSKASHHTPHHTTPHHTTPPLTTPHHTIPHHTTPHHTTPHHTTYRLSVPQLTLLVLCCLGQGTVPLNANSDSVLAAGQCGMTCMAASCWCDCEVKLCRRFLPAACTHLQTRGRHLSPGGMPLTFCLACNVAR